VSRDWVKPPGPVAQGLRIGLLGGSFNPAHAGHQHVSEVGLRRLGLDYVWWLVSPQNPLKPRRGMAALSERLAKARACARLPREIVTGIEQELGTRYTHDTVRALLTRFPEPRFVWLMGSDNLAQFDHWRAWTEIASLLPVAVVIRPGSTLAPLFAKAAQRYARNRVAPSPGFANLSPPALAIVDDPRNPLSGTTIRNRVTNPSQ